MEEHRYTELYTVFDEIIRKKHTALPGISKETYFKASGVNQCIKNAVKELALMRDDSSTYITVKENGVYILSASDTPDAYMRIIKYEGYKYLFLDYADCSVLLNYVPESELFCCRGEIPYWSYLCLTEPFYMPVPEIGFYMINSWEAYCEYVEMYKHDPVLTKEYNSVFYPHAKRCLFADEQVFRRAGETVSVRVGREGPFRVG